MENKGTIKKINETKICFFEKFKKIDNFLKNQKILKDFNTTKIRSYRESIITDLTR